MRFMRWRAYSSLDDDGVRERCSQWLPQLDRLQRLGDARYDACICGDSGGGVAFVTYRRRPSMVLLLGFRKSGSSLDGLLVSLLR